MPSILEVSRELLRRSPRPPTVELPADVDSTDVALDARVSALEENERRQAELIKAMADQLAQLTTAVTALHEHTRRLLIGLGVTAAVAVSVLVLAVRGMF
jgi:uncharacterized coiled-coil protein SlyX